jgi:hypothetical protein
MNTFEWDWKTLNGKIVRHSRTERRSSVAVLVRLQELFRKLTVGTNENPTPHSREKQSPNMSLLLRSPKYLVMLIKITLSRQ